jgi:hypothetical protein
VASRERFSGIFDVALVLLFVLGSTETTYFAKVWNDQTALKFAVTPFILIILIWLMKELFKADFEKEKKLELWLLTTEWCWEVWSLSLAYYLFFLVLFQLPTFPTIALADALGIGLIIFVAILVAYCRQYREEISNYYKNPKWLIYRAISAIVFAFVVYLIFLPI